MRFRIQLMRLVTNVATPDSPMRDGQFIAADIQQVDDQVLEIGDQYVVCASNRFFLHQGEDSKNPKLLLKPSLTFRKCDTIALSDHFTKYPSLKAPIGVFWRAGPFREDDDSSPSVGFELALNERNFGVLASQVTQGTLLSSIGIDLITPNGRDEIEGQSYEFGWEPDGSRTIWKPKKLGLAYLAVEAFSMTHDVGNLTEPDPAGRPDEDIKQVTQTSVLQGLLEEMRVTKSDIAESKKLLKWLAVMLGIILLALVLRG